MGLLVNGCSAENRTFFQIFIDAYCIVAYSQDLLLHGHVYVQLWKLFIYILFVFVDLVYFINSVTKARGKRRDSSEGGNDEAYQCAVENRLF